MPKKSTVHGFATTLAEDLLSFVAELARRSADRDRIIEIALSFLRAAIGADLCVLSIPNGEAFGIQAAVGGRHVLAELRTTTGRRTLASVVGINDGAALFEQRNDVRPQAGISLRARYDVVSTLVVPIRTGGRLVALVEVHSRSTRTFCPAEAELVNRLGSMLHGLLAPGLRRAAGARLTPLAASHDIG